MLFIYWGYELYRVKSRAERSFAMVLSLLNHRGDLVDELLRFNFGGEEIKAILTELRAVLIEIKEAKKDIHLRLLKEHQLSEKLTQLFLKDEKPEILKKIEKVTQDIHDQVEKYNAYVERINAILTGRYSKYLFMLIRIPRSAPIDI